MGATIRTYLVECYWPGVSETKLAEAVERADGETAARCVESILIPADEIVLCLFEARSAGAVRDATRRARLPSERIVESVRIQPHRQ